MTFRSLGGHHIHYTTETSKSKADKSSVVIHVFQVIDVDLYVGLSEAGFQSREGFHPGEIGVSYTFELATRCTDSGYGLRVALLTMYSLCARLRRKVFRTLQPMVGCVISKFLRYL
ncbi:hypothetical protein DPMN_002895 [Dreissena polymorpha]|uniref:Uncharacterized protein n=1 Tax=Dreissena polymorpha TaxID=45954 RepID=A0A9D4MNN9_DREPO|nr:hypothetical protein DPMN_002895 [Dreissena polymorpha]